MNTKTPAQDDIFDTLLRRGPCSVFDISDDTGRDPEQVRKVINRMRASGKVVWSHGEPDGRAGAPRKLWSAVS